MYPCSAGRQSNVEPLSHHHGNRQGRDQRARDFHLRPGIHMFQPQQYQRCPAPLRRAYAIGQTGNAITQIVRHHAETKSWIIMFDHHRDTHE